MFRVECLFLGVHSESMLYLELLKIVVLAFSTSGNLVGHTHIYIICLCFTIAPIKSLVSPWADVRGTQQETSGEDMRRPWNGLKTFFGSAVGFMGFPCFLLMLLCGLVVHQVSMISVPKKSCKIFVCLEIPTFLGENPTMFALFFTARLKTVLATVETKVLGCDQAARELVVTMKDWVNFVQDGALGYKLFIKFITPPNQL